VRFTSFVEDGCCLKRVNERCGFRVGTRDLLPSDYFCHLFCQLPELVDIDVTTG